MHEPFRRLRNSLAVSLSLSIPLHLPISLPLLSDSLSPYIPGLVDGESSESGATPAEIPTSRCVRGYVEVKPESSSLLQGPLLPVGLPGWRVYGGR